MDNNIYHMVQTITIDQAGIETIVKNAIEQHTGMTVVDIDFNIGVDFDDHDPMDKGTSVLTGVTCRLEPKS